MCVRVWAATHIVPVLLRKVDAGRTTLDAGTVDEDVDVPAHLFEGGVENVLDSVEVGEVACNVLGTWDAVDDGGRVAGDETEVGTGLCKCDGTGLADSAGCSRDEDVSVCEGEKLGCGYVCGRRHVRLGHGHRYPVRYAISEPLARSVTRAQRTGAKYPHR